MHRNFQGSSRRYLLQAWSSATTAKWRSQSAGRGVKGKERASGAGVKKKSHAWDERKDNTAAIDGPESKAVGGQNQAA